MTYWDTAVGRGDLEPDLTGLMGWWRLDPVRKENMASLVQKLEEFQDSDHPTSKHTWNPAKHQARVTPQVACPDIDVYTNVQLWLISAQVV